ncbi:hypothetical protein AA313_de0207105 [Arthrobotrys entomopaga]|nr:hypothetical protein AA313_de0207105 [Arthrobotrys entomopaga]
MEYFGKKLLETVNPTVAREMVELFEEYEAQETKEAVFVKDIDVYDMILQAFEYEKEYKGKKSLQRFMKAERRLKTEYVKGWNRELMEERDKFWSTVDKADA